MILIADGGSTKCDWVLMDAQRNVVSRTNTKGINPMLLSIPEMCDILFENKMLVGIYKKINTVLFYGAGCGNDSGNKALSKLFSEFFPNATIYVEEDLMAAVHGTTKEPGVVCILGTGSNCCYYDGKRVCLNQLSLGYTVMDEGSGNYFGKKLLNSYFYNKMPIELKNRFEVEFDLSLEVVLKNLYENKNPSAYLAKFAPFLIKNKSVPYFKEIIKRGLNDLFNNLISCYKEELLDNPIHFVGSIAFNLQGEILQIAKERNIKVGSFVRRPVDNIIKNIDGIYY